MDIGISWNAYGGLETEYEFELLKSNGFTHFFPDSDNPQLEKIMKAAAENGIACDMFHAPFRKINNIWYDTQAGEEMAASLKNAVDTCEKFGVPVAVVHLSSGDNAPNINDTGINRFIDLVNYATEKGVKIAFENQRKLGNIAYAFEKCPDAVFCWDVGHEACFANGLEFMPLFGKKLTVLHIHDNDGVHNEDLHMLPFDASLDFDRIARHIAKSDFNGAVMLEVFRRISGRYENMSAPEYYKRAADAARRLRDKIEEYRQ